MKVYGDRLISLAVFGSVGRGTPRTNSDVDILVVADNLPPGRIKRVLEFEKVDESIEIRPEDSRLYRRVVNGRPGLTFTVSIA